MNIKINDKVFEEFPVIESKRLIYREFKKSDAQDIFLIRSNDDVMTYMDCYQHQNFDLFYKLFSTVNIRDLAVIPHD